MIDFLGPSWAKARRFPFHSLTAFSHTKPIFQLVNNSAMAKNTKNPRIRWASKSAIARDLGLNRGTVVTWSGKEDFPGGAGGPWYADQVIPWLVTKRTPHTEDDDPVLGGPVTPALERYRAVRADHAELDLQKAKGALVDRDLVRDILCDFARLFRRAGESLGKRFGADAQTILDEAIDDCHLLITALSDPSKRDGPDGLPEKSAS